MPLKQPDILQTETWGGTFAQCYIILDNALALLTPRISLLKELFF